MNRIGTAGRWLAVLTVGFGIAACNDAPLGIVPVKVANLRIEPARPVLPSIGDSLQLALFATSANGSTTECEAAWKSSDAKTVQVNSRGKVVGKAAGVALIIATCGGAVDSTEIVVGAEVHSIAISKTTVTLAAGGSEGLYAVAHDKGGYAIPGVTFSWKSSNPAVATVDSTGRVAGVAAGTADVTASASGKSAVATVTVTGGSTPQPSASGDFVVYPNSQVEFILGPQLRSGSSANPWPWFDQNASARGLHHGNEFPVASAIGDWDHYINLNYYDQGLVQYLNYYRTGNAAFQTHARKIADSWWGGPLKSGTVGVENSMAPRNISLGGLMLRALDGRPEMWPWITDYTRVMFNMWVGNRVNNSSLYYGLRDGGYMLQYAAWLAEVHPDATVRAEFKQKALVAARDYYVRLQKADGGWYWEDDGNTWGQPFMIGLMLDGMVSTHRLTQDPALRASILKAVDHIYKSYRINDVVPERPDLRWRSVPYFVYPDGKISAETNLEAGWDLNTIREGRQRNSLIVHAFGYAYHLTKDPKYRSWGDEIFAATYGRTTGNLYDTPLSPQGPLADGLTGLADFRAKEYNQAYRSAGRYLGWRLD